jgi:hypothetical protein
MEIILVVIAGWVIFTSFVLVGVSKNVNKLLALHDLSKEDAAVLSATKNVKDAQSKIPPPEAGNQKGK